MEKLYFKMTNSKLKEIVDHSIFDLTPTGLEVLKEEIARRALPLLSDIKEAFEQREARELAIDQKCEELRNLSCPMCGGVEYKLNAIQLLTIDCGFRAAKRIHFGCFHCLKAEKLKGERDTSIWAWLNIWQLPFNLRIISHNDKSVTALHKDEVTDQLRDVAYQLIEAEKAERRQNKHSSIEVAVEITITKQQELQ